MSDIQDNEAVDPATQEAGFESRRIERPHPDIEHGVDRSPVDDLVRVPDAGLNP